MSKIEVNTVEPQCGTTLTVGKCTTNLRSGGNSLQAADGGNLISQSGTDITLGASGDTIALASGASQTGFGREGSVDWQTGSIKTGTFTPVTGEGYFVNTSGGVSTVELPAGVAGSIVAIADYTRTFNSNNCTITANGSEKIGGIAQNATLSVDGQSATFVYVDGTEGWINVQETQTSQRGLPPFIQATGGTPSQSGDYEIRTFTGPGTFCVTSLSPSAPENAVDWMVIAGGASGGSGSGGSGGGGGAGGFRESPGTATGSYTASPIAGGAAVTVAVQGYPITVGAGGANTGGNGNNSIFGCYTSTAGGKGASTGALAGSPYAAATGGSGGGGDGCVSPSPAAGNTPSTSPAQGFAGGVGRTVGGDRAGGGGGGATAAGVAGAPYRAGGDGGAGATSSNDGTPTARAGGGGGSGQGGDGGCGGAGGGGDAGGADPSPGCAGSENTGGGGGAGNGPAACSAGAGGSGVVILRYKFQ